MRIAVSKSRSNKTLGTALLTTLVITLGASVSACSGTSNDEILAVDRVDQAADIARQLGPKAEDMGFPEPTPLVVADADTAEVDSEGAEMTPAADMPTDDATGAAAGAEDLAVNVGADLYNKQCMACHATGLLNAPKYGDAAAWAPRISKGLETLTLHSAQGFNQMPAQATNGVTEEQVHAAVEYMVAAAS